MARPKRALLASIPVNLLPPRQVSPLNSGSDVEAVSGVDMLNESQDDDGQQSDAEQAPNEGDNQNAENSQSRANSGAEVSNSEDRYKRTGNAEGLLVNEENGGTASGRLEEEQRPSKKEMNQSTNEKKRPKKNGDLTAAEELERIERSRKKRYVDASIPLLTRVTKKNERKKMVFWFSRGFPVDLRANLMQLIQDNGGLVTKYIEDSDYPLLAPGLLSDVSPIIDKINMKGFTAIHYAWITDSVEQVIKNREDGVTRENERPLMCKLEDYYRISTSPYKPTPTFRGRDFKRWENEMDEDDKILLKGLKKRKTRGHTYQELFEHLEERHDKPARRWQKIYSKNRLNFEYLVGPRKESQQSQGWESDPEEAEEEPSEENDENSDTANQRKEEVEEKGAAQLHSETDEDLPDATAIVASSIRSPPKPPQPPKIRSPSKRGPGRPPKDRTPSPVKRARGRPRKNPLPISQPQSGGTSTVKANKSSSVAAAIGEKDQGQELRATRSRSRRQKNPSFSLDGDIYSMNSQKRAPAEARRRIAERKAKAKR